MLVAIEQHDLFASFFSGNVLHTSSWFATPQKQNPSGFALGVPARPLQAKRLEVAAKRAHRTLEFAET